MNILITGSDGFIASHLIRYLEKQPNINIAKINRNSSYSLLRSEVKRADFICHLAGVNRTSDISEFDRVNRKFTLDLANIIQSENKKIPIYFASSIHANLLTDYGISKVAAEKILINLNEVNGNIVTINRLHRVYGPGAKPNYNSVIATFSHNIANNLPIYISDESQIIDIIYIDDVVKVIYGLIYGSEVDYTKLVEKISLGNLVKLLYSFESGVNCCEEIDSSLVSKIYLTYLSYKK